MRPTSCKVCNSPYMNDYEKRYYDSKGQVAYEELSRMASGFNEEISRKSFQNHFDTHYQSERIQEMLSKGMLEENIEASKAEAINILDEIKTNLAGLKTLIAAAKGTNNLTDIVSVYREHRLTLQDIERLRSKLTSTSSLSKADLYKEIYFVYNELCPECRDKFWVKLDERLKRRGFT